MTTNTLKFFTLLRFPLMVGVVMIHCDISDQLVPELRGQWAQDVMYFFSNIIGRFSVPMFFLISGFLFYRNGTLTHNEYASKLHHRLYTLLIPYLLWNLIAFLFFIAKHYPPLCPVFQGITEIPISFENFLKSFWEFRFEGLGESKSMPIDFPLWYVRDLMIVVLCSPLLYKLIKCGRLLVGLIGGIWLSFNPEFCGIDMTGFFFFTLGGYFSMNKVDLADIFKSRKAKISTMFLFVIVIIADMITRGETYHYLLHNITILTGMIVMFICADLILRLSIGKSTILIEHFASTTFFVYALHGLFVAPLRKGLCLALQPTSNTVAVMTYMLSILTTIILSLITYYVLKKLCPQFCSLLNGGR